MHDTFTDRQAAGIRRAIEHAEGETGIRFSVYIGSAPGEGAEMTAARRLHAAIGPDAARTVLIFVDPAARFVEIVTGARIRRRVDDRSCGLAAISMAAAFSVGDLAGGIRAGINQLMERARRPPTEYEHQRAPD